MSLFENSVLSYVIFSLELVVIGALVLYLLHYYGNFKRDPWYIFVVAWVGWTIPFSVVVLIPIDISSVMRPFTLRSRTFLTNYLVRILMSVV